MQMDNDLKHTVKATQDIVKAKKGNILQEPSQMPYVNLIKEPEDKWNSEYSDGQRHSLSVKFFFRY